MKFSLLKAGLKSVAVCINVLQKTKQTLESAVLFHEKNDKPVSRLDCFNSYAELSAFLNKPPNTVIHYLHGGKIPYTRNGNNIHVTRDHVLNAIKIYPFIGNCMNKEKLASPLRYTLSKCLNGNSFVHLTYRNFCCILYLPPSIVNNGPALFNVLYDCVLMRDKIYPFKTPLDSYITNHVYNPAAA
jgi:hypothetical protein